MAPILWRYAIGGHFWGGNGVKCGDEDSVQRKAERKEYLKTANKEGRKQMEVLIGKGILGFTNVNYQHLH